MYNLVYLPVAKQDMADIVRYISEELHNPVAAERLAEKLVDAAENLRMFPYACPVYAPIRPLAREYRRLLVQNYLLFYVVDETKKCITVARVTYARRDMGTVLE